jgi:hypothetical protein
LSTSSRQGRAATGSFDRYLWPQPAGISLFTVASPTRAVVCLTLRLPQLSAILTLLEEHKDAHHFATPVAELWAADQLHDYETICPNPSDLRTVRQELASHSPETFAADIRRIFKNACANAPPGSEAAVVAWRMCSFFEEHLRQARAPAKRERRPSAAVRVRLCQ